MKNQLKYSSIDSLYLDPLNPRLGRGNTGPKVTQGKILELMRDWELEELAISFLESGFWPQEALIVSEEMLYGSKQLVVIEGNRRLAALKMLQDAANNSKSVGRKWLDIVKNSHPPKSLFDKIPYIQADSRKEVEAFLGFRHVTGIKEWAPAEKAEYIAKLIEESSMSYIEVMRKIGSKTNTVRQNYIAFRLLIQMEGQPGISVEHVEDKFSVLFLSLRTAGVQGYLSVDLSAEPPDAKTPVPKGKIANLKNFSLWLFGDDKRAPVVRDSRQVDRFGRILESKKAVEYLERTSNPSFDMAFQLAGGDEPEIIRLVEEAADNIEAALSRAHRFTKSKKLRAAALRAGQDINQLVSLFPGLADELEEDV